MCVVCGCNAEQAASSEHPAQHAQGQGDALHYGAGPAGMAIPGMSQARTIRMEADVLGENNRLAERNRAHFASHGVTAINLVSSPGSGKTTLLCASIQALKVRA